MPQTTTAMKETICSQNIQSLPMCYQNPENTNGFYLIAKFRDVKRRSRTRGDFRVKLACHRIAVHGDMILYPSSGGSSSGSARLPHLLLKFRSFQDQKGF